MNKNITLSIEEKILKKAKFAALEEDQSLSQWVTQLIKKSLIKEKNYELAKAKALKHLDEGLPLGGKPIPRNELYDR